MYMPIFVDIMTKQSATRAAPLEINRSRFSIASSFHFEGDQY